MIVGVLTLELFFPYARSLKDKRRILHGFKDRLHRHNVALAETEFQDLWPREHGVESDGLDAATRVTAAERLM